MKIKTPHIDKELQQIGDAAVKALQSQLGKEELGSSDLSKNIKYTLKNEVLSINVPGYGIYVDEGTEPHMPPVSSIEKWARSKGLNAWAVAKGIEKWGTEAQPFLFEVNKTFKASEDYLADAGLDDVVNVTDKMFEKTGGTMKKKN